MRRAFQWVAVSLLAALVSALVLPACVLKIQKGGTGGGGGSPATQEPTAGSGVGGGGSDAGNAIDDKAFAAADQQELALRAVTAAYAANVTASLVEAQLPDPAQADPALVEQLIEESAPAGWDAALQWLASVDISTLAIDKGVYTNYTCTEEPYLCKASTWCPFAEGGVTCSVSQCGTGKCPWCPFGGNLVFKAWCAYGCIRNSDSEVVGGAFILRTIFNNYDGPFCIKF